ncbi:MAG: radical SAM protein [Elusimicrobia bacterium]|nr:radical SAM protein [Elusimicrobiota bacterium]
MANLGYIQVVRKCNQECRFCSNPANERELSLSQAKRFCERYRRRGYDGVILTGGEPTLYEPLPELIAYAQGLGLGCRIITNGQRTADPAYLRSLMSAGLRHLHVTVHSHRKPVQSFLSGNPDSLPNIVRTLALLSRYQADVDINQTICAQNSDHIHETVRWLCQRFPYIHHFSWTCLDTLTGRVAGHPETVPALRGLKDSLLAAMRWLERTDRTFRVEKVPLCYMGEFAHCSTETRALVRREERSIDFLDARRHYRERQWSFGYGKPAACRLCSLTRICAGLWDMGQGYDPAEVVPQKTDPRPILRRILGPGGGSRHESAETHQGGEGGVELILRTTSACNQRCPFCFLPGHDRSMPSARIERELAALARRLGPRDELTLSGGEPLADARLPKVIASARRKGIRRFALQSNGVGLARPGMLSRLLALGVRSYDIAFHAHKPALYDRITCSRWQFKTAVAGLTRLLAAPHCRVTVCVLVNAWNYRELPALMGFLGRLARKTGRIAGDPLQVGLSMMNGRGHELAPSFAVDLRRVAPFLRRALARGRRVGLLMQRFTGETALPPCLLSDAAGYAGRFEMSQEGVRYGADFSGEAGSVGRAKLPGCRRCPHDRRCLGVPAPYARRFGLAALRPPRGRRAP